MSMGLASMNPMPGAVTGALMIKSKPDKDLEKDGWADYYATKSFDNDDMLGMHNGKVSLRKTSDLKECQVYIINAPKVDEIYNSLLKEALDEDSEIHPDPGYIYSAFTGKYLLTDDQFNFDPLLERVYLDKLSKRLNADASNLENEYAMKTLNKHEGFYPVKREEEDSNVNFPLLDHAVVDRNVYENLLDNYLDKFMKGEGEEIVEDI